jgi:adenylosuccinate synthase
VARHILLLSGPISAGKSTLARRLNSRYGAIHIRTRELLRARLPDLAEDRLELQRGGVELDEATTGAWVAQDVGVVSAQHRDDAILVVDSIRIPQQINVFRHLFGPRVVHIHLRAAIETLEGRYSRRADSTETSYADARLHSVEAAVGTLAELADVVIETDRSTEDDVLVRAASHLGYYSRSYARLADVLIGGQWGSEGKGHIASYLAPEYQVLVRVGGPNAGHKVFELEGEFTFHQLPSGSRTNQEAQLLIAPGAVLDVRKMLEEVEKAELDVERLSVDPSAMVIDRRDAAFESRTLRKWIGSTAQGVGAATSRRVMRGALGPGLSRVKALQQVRLAKDVKELQPYVREIRPLLDDTFNRGDRVFVEGTQGTGLSLYHGDFPHVTSRDTTVAGCLSEAGIAPTRLRKIVMVMRSLPIRVGDPEGEMGMTSGPMGLELTMESVAKRAGLDAEKMKAREMTSTTHRPRRIAEFSWAQLRKSASLNGPTDVALTFADYIDASNQDARRLDQLTRETILFIQEIERIAAAPVSLISTRFDLPYRSIIDRRAW